MLQYLKSNQQLGKKDPYSKFLQGQFLLQGYQDVNNFQCKLDKHNI